MSKKTEKAQKTVAITTKKSKLWEKSTLFLTKIAVLAAISLVIFIVMDFHIFPAFPMFKLDFAEVPVLLGAFSMGPLAAVAIEAVKVLFGMLITGPSWGGVGDLSNFLVNIAFVVPAAIIYRRFHSKKGAFFALAAGNVCLYLFACLSNAFVMLPLVGWTEEPVYTTTILVGLGFNAIKGVSNSFITILLYKRLSPILKLDKIPERAPLIGEHNIKSLSGTARLAERFAKSLKGGEIILLNGDLGAGKTTFAKSLLKSLGVKEAVTSPTFTIMKRYEGEKFSLNHFDLYRIESTEELEELGFDEYLSEPNAISIVEWNKFERLNGTVYSVSIIRTGNKSRSITIAKGVREAEENTSSEENASFEENSSSKEKFNPKEDLTFEEKSVFQTTELREQKQVTESLKSEKTALNMPESHRNESEGEGEQ